MALLHVGIGISFLALCVPGLLWLWKKKEGSRRARIGLLLLLCCGAGYARMAAYEAAAPGGEALSITKGKPVTVQGKVAGISSKPNSVGLTLTDCSLVWKEALYPLPDMAVYLKPEVFRTADEAETVRLGMEISLRGIPQKPSQARNPGEFDFCSYYQAQGIYYQMFGEQPKLVNRSFWRYRDGLYRLRQSAGRILDELCEPQDGGIFKAAVLGDKTSLDEEVRDLYQRNGIAHLLAISGLHISLVGLGLYRIFRRTGLGYGTAGALGVAVIVSYGIMTGASSSVVRAVLMVLLYMLAEYLGRSYDMLSAAGLACVLLLWESPGLISQGGVWLSFGAVGAIGGLGPWMAEKLEVKGGFQKALVLSGSVQMVTCPMILYYFYQYPVYGVLLNLVVIPLMAYVVISGILGILLGAVWLPAGMMAVGSGHYILSFYLRLCRWCERLPGANLVVGKPDLWQIGAYILLLGLLLWTVSFLKNRGAKRRIRLGVLAAGVLAGFLILCQLPVRGMEVTWLDVGQGDGMCIRTKDTVILVDGGSSDKKTLGENTLEPYLKSLGICQVDYAVISHGDKDHISGIRYLLEENGDIHIKNLILPWLGREDESYRILVELMELHGGRVHWMQEGERIGAGALSLTCLYHGDEKKKQDRNEHSLLLKLYYDGFSMLLTGDMSSEGEKDVLDQHGEELEGTFLLKAAHHGSKYSSCEAFLSRTDPEWTVISCGEDNSYGHPHKEVLERLRRQGSNVLITVDTGAITAQVKRGKIRLRTFLPESDS